MSRDIALTELAAEIRAVTWEQGERTQALWFDCPLCGGDHRHLVPFREGRPAHGATSQGRNIWGHTGGTTTTDITLAPSYLATGGGCHLHAFVRDGVLQVLADSRRHS